MTDYHDRWISDLERIAEETTAKLIQPYRLAKPMHSKRVQQWSKTLAGIAIPKTIYIPWLWSQ